MRRSGWEAPTYPSFDFRQSAEKSLVLSMKLASARTLRARGSGTGPGRWVDLASLKASRPRMYALGRAGRPRSRHFTAKRLSKTKLALHKRNTCTVRKLDEEEDKMFDECNAFVTTFLKCGRVSQQQIHARGRARAARSLRAQPIA